MRKVIINGYTCTPMNGGYWSVEGKGEFYAWLSKSEVREITSK